MKTLKVSNLMMNMTTIKKVYLLRKKLAAVEVLKIKMITTLNRASKRN